MYPFDFFYRWFLHYFVVVVVVVVLNLKFLQTNGGVFHPSIVFYLFSMMMMMMWLQNVNAQYFDTHSGQVGGEKKFTDD